MYQHITTINGKLWAITAPSIEPDDQPNIQFAIESSSDPLHALLKKFPSDEAFWTRTLASDSGFCRVTELTCGWGVNMEHSFDYRPAFIPVDSAGNYAPHVLDSIPEGDAFPFCFATMGIPDSQIPLPQTNKHLSKFKPESLLRFHDLTSDVKEKFKIYVVKVNGALVATRNLVSKVSFSELYEMNLIQFDMKPSKRSIAWIDGEPWEVRTPAAFATDEASKNALIQSDTLLRYLREIVVQKYPSEEFFVLTSSKGPNPGSISAYHVGAINCFHNMSITHRNQCVFLPEFVPLSPDTFEENLHYFDSFDLEDGSESPEVRELGSLYVNGAVASLNSTTLGHSYDKNERLEISDTSFDMDGRIQVVRRGNHFMAISPVLSEVSYHDLAGLGLAQETS